MPNLKPLLCKFLGHRFQMLWHASFGVTSVTTKKCERCECWQQDVRANWQMIKAAPFVFVDADFLSRQNLN
jgi:hypothetical protein